MNNQFTPEENIFKLLGLEDLPELEKNKILAKMEETIREKVIYLVVTQLSDEECEELNSKMDQGLDQAGVIADLQEKIPDLQAKIRELIENFKKELIEEVATIKKELVKTESEIKQNLSDKQAKQQKYQQLKDIERRMQQAAKEEDFDKVLRLMEERKNMGNT